MTYTLPTPKTPLNIGTRGSPLALAQAYETRARLAKAFDLPFEAFEIVVIMTTAIASPIAHSKKSAVKGYLPAKSSKPCWMDPSTSLCIP